VGAAVYRLLRDTVDIGRAGTGTTDRYGNPVPGADTYTTVPASVVPVQSLEDEQDRDTRLSDFLVILPSGTDVTALDRIRWRGEVFDVQGRPRLVINGRGEDDHIEVTVRREEG
jgi:head-tail adaptor